MTTAIIVGLYALVVLFDLLPLRKTWNFKEGAVYCAVLLIGFCGLFLYSINAQLPSPTKAIVAIVTAIFPNAG